MKTKHQIPLGAYELFKFKKLWSETKELDVIDSKDVVEHIDIRRTIIQGKATSFVLSENDVSFEVEWDSYMSFQINFHNLTIRLWPLTGWQKGELKLYCLLFNIC